MFTGHGRAGVFRILRIWADLIAALGFLIAVGTYLSIDERGTGLPLVLASTLAGLGYLAGCAIAVVVWSMRRRWARAGTSATKAVVFVFLLGPCLRAGDDVHLALFYPAYRRAIEAHERGDDKPMRFDWGDKALWVTDGFQGETLVYDSTDALAVSVGDAPWSDEHGFNVSTRHLIGHFYVEYRSSP